MCHAIGEYVRNFPSATISFIFTKLSFSGSEKILTMNRQQTLFLIISEKYLEKHRETGKTEALVLTLVRKKQAVPNLIPNTTNDLASLVCKDYFDS